MDESKRRRVTVRLLDEIEKVLYAKDIMNKRDKVDRIISVLEEEYDF